MPAALNRSHPAITHKDLMLATPGKLASWRGWIYELKHDGYRCLTQRVGDQTLLWSRNGNDMAARFPELVNDVAAIEHPIVFDGELVVLDDTGRAQWDRLRQRHATRSPQLIQAMSIVQPAAIFAFDLLWYRGKDYRARPLIERKAALAKALKNCQRVKYADHFKDSCVELWDLANRLELEGIVAKDATSSYTAGRTSRWLKIKTTIGEERERARRP